MFSLTKYCLTFFILLLPAYSIFSTTPLQTLTHGSYTYRIDISSNNEILVMGGDLPPHVYVYTNNGSRFILSDTITKPTTHLDGVDITSDGEWIYISEGNAYSYVYRYNYTTNKYDLFQTLSHNSEGSDSGAITDDLWIVYPKNNGYVHVFNFDGN